MAQDGVWQWHVDMPQSTNKKGMPKAYLWIPPSCQELKGLVLAQHNMEEISILEDAEFRLAMEEIDFGIIWYAPMFDVSFNFVQGAGEQFNKSLEDLAQKSGYDEITRVPYLAIGHSAAASWPYYLAAWSPEKTICCISVSGQWPYVRNERVAPDIWGSKNIDYIPCLETMGEYEAAENWSNEGLKERQEHPLLPLSMLACPGEGHFAAGSEKIDYIVQYIKKAIAYRMPSGSLPLVKIDPTKTGFLADRWKKKTEPRWSMAPVAHYAGDAADAFWFFDEEHAKATAAYQSRYRSKLVSLLGIEVCDSLVAQRNTHLQITLPFNKMNTDGKLAFKLSFLDSVPDGSPRLPVWTDLPVGAALAHPTSTDALYLEKICGPFEVIDNSVIKLKLNRVCCDSEENDYEAAFAIKYPGDEQFRAAVQQGNFFVAANNIAGAEQEIVFPSISNIKSSKKSVKLHAKSTAGLQVAYYIVSGPVEVVDNALQLTSIPAKSKYPIEVTVVAWQQGTTKEPLYQSAKVVKQSFYITQ